MRIAIIGAGNMGSIYSRIVAENPYLELVAIIGNRSESVDKLTMQYGGVPYYKGDIRSALSDFQDLDAVILATPEWVRLDPILEIIRAEKHLLFEKPIASNFMEAQTIYDALSESKIVSMPAFTLRFTPQYSSGYQKLQSCDIGDIRHISSRRNGNKHIAKRIIDNMSPFYWLSPHEIDLIRWFTHDEIKWVQAVKHQGKNMIDGYLLANLHLVNGIDVQHMVSWCTPGISDASNQSLFEVFASKGMLHLSENHGLGSVYMEKDVVKSIDVGYSPIVGDQLVGPFKNIIDHFIHCVINNKPPCVTIKDALESVRVCSAMEKSAQEKRLVKLEEIT